MRSLRCLSGMRSFLLATALPLSVLATGLTSAHAGSDVQTGVAGTIGANGVNPGDAGGNAGDGGPAAASAVNSDPLNSATATGGKGGSGGTGFGSGNGGAGGAGGQATSVAATSVGAASTIAAAVANGGAGGSAGFTGATGLGANGGAGGAGAASSSATNTDAGGVFLVQDAATATGGAGGQSFSPGGIGGAGGTIAVGAVKAFGSSVGDFVSATATASGGPGGNGVNGANGGAGGAANLTDAATGSTTGTFNPIQSAIGGAGGLTFGLPAGSAGVGGAASSQLHVDDKSAASVIASSSAQGGLGGETLGGTAGAGGASSATLQLGSNVATNLQGSAAATGGSGGTDFSTGALAGAGGEANARDAVHAKGGFGSAGAVALGGISDTSPGAASANARVTGATTGSALALSKSRTTFSSVTATGSAPVGGPASASTKASFGAGPPALAPIGAGEAISNAELTPADSTFAVGAMSAGYGGTGESLTYMADAHFLFATSESDELIFNLLDYDVAGAGFDELNLDVKVNGADHPFSFTLLSAAEAFFGGNPLDFGAIDAGNQDIEISFALAASRIGDGFGFAYDFGPSKTDLPEASTWAMTLVGFASLAFAARSRHKARTAKVSSRNKREATTPLGRRDDAYGVAVPTAPKFTAIRPRRLRSLSKRTLCLLQFMAA
jgi:hypothetical protein